jgi:hypothetical protein
MDNKRRWIWLGLLGPILAAVFIMAAGEGRRLFVTTVQAGSRPDSVGEMSFDSRPLTELREKAPEFRNVAAWINTKPLQMKELRGKVVAVNFWAFG